MSSIYRKLPLSDLAAADSLVGLYRTVISRRAQIRWQLDNKPGRLPDSVVVKARSDLAKLSEIAHRLVVNSVISNARRDMARFGTLDQHLDSLFGDFRIRRTVNTPDSDPVVRAALRNAAEMAARARRSSALWRFGAALEQATNAGWYAIFNTLTVRPCDYHAVFAQNSALFNQYVTRVSNAIGIAAHGSVSKARAAGNDFHRYFAVVESGERNGRLHIHVVHLCRVLPADCADPARGAGNRHHRKIAAFKKFWHHGFSAPIAVRYGASDVFGRAGWLWPESSDGSPARLGSWHALAGYMSKYVSKSLTSTDRGDYKWRIRISRGLGLERLRSSLATMPATRLLALAHALPPTRGQMCAAPETVIPPSILRRQATREIVRRLLSERHERPPRRTPPLRPNSPSTPRHRSTSREMVGLNARPSLVQRLRASNPLSVAPNSRNTGSTLTVKFMSTVISDFARVYAAESGYNRFIARGGQSDLI